MVDDEIARLPHWARVAFAARCGRAGVKLFRAAWPSAAPAHLAAVLAAVERAEQSAAAGAAVPGSLSVSLEAGCVAGLALMASTPNPPRQSAAASLAAKPAEFAARTAAAGPDDSATLASKAHTFALQAIWEAGAGDMEDRLAADLARIGRVAVAERWTDHTPASPSVFGKL